MTDNTEQRQASARRPATTYTASGPLTVDSPSVRYTPDTIHACYEHVSVQASVSSSGAVSASPRHTKYHFRTARVARRLGLLQVGWGGNNATTVTASVLARNHSIHWRSRTHQHTPNYNGTLTQAATLRIGFDADGRDVFVPLSSVIPLANPDDLVLGGWDISSFNLADAADRAAVLEPDLLRQLRPHMEKLRPLPAAFDPKFIAKNQYQRADNIIDADKAGQLESLRKNIRDFKRDNDLEFVVVVWTANSERYAEELAGVNDTADNLLQSIEQNHSEISPSTLYAVAAILEGCPYVNGSPQNTLVPGAMELARRHNVGVVGDDFKSGQTKMKSVLVDYLVGCGVKVRTMVTYNHLGNNDMYQLTDEVMWKPKSASKSRVIDDIVDANGVLYKGDAKSTDRPDHVVVVKYVPFLGDSKRDVSEYTSETFMDCRYTTIMHNECLDSALCAPLIIDLALFAELIDRVRYRVVGNERMDNMDFESDGDDMEFNRMDPVLSVLGFYMKIPRTPPGEPVVNALGRQKACIENLLRALVGLPPESHMLLETKCPVGDAA